MNVRAWILSLVVLSLGGCDDGEEEAGPASAAEEVAAPVSQPTVQPDPETVPSPPSPGAVGGTGPGQADRMKQVGEALAQAAQAASEAEEAGATSCERAYNGAVAMSRSMHEQMGRGGSPRLPQRERFIEGCRQLPEEVQRCMIVGYAVQNQAECQRVRQAHPEIGDQVRELVGAGAEGG